MKIWILIAALCLGAVEARGDVAAETLRHGGPKSCSDVLLCGNQTATGACTRTAAQCTGAGAPFSCCTGAGTGPSCGSDEITTNLADDDRYVTGIYATSSTATTFSCYLYTTDAATYDTAGDTPAQITDNDGSALLTHAKRYRSIASPMKRAWIECNALSGGQVTVTAQSCPLGR
jgi:hypothetical protein